MFTVITIVWAQLSKHAPYHFLEEKIVCRIASPLRSLYDLKYFHFFICLEWNNIYCLVIAAKLYSKIYVVTFCAKVLCKWHKTFF